MNRRLAIRICPYWDHSLSHLDKAFQSLFGWNMQYTCCSYTGVQCFCHIAHGTNNDLKRNKEKLKGLRFCEYYLISFTSRQVFNVNSRNTRSKCEICSKLAIKTPERCQWRWSGVFIVNFEYFSHLVLVFPLLTLSRWTPGGLPCMQWVRLFI